MSLNSIFRVQKPKGNFGVHFLQQQVTRRGAACGGVKKLIKLRLRIFSFISSIVGHTLQTLALQLLPETSQLIYEKIQIILKSCTTDICWEHYENALVQAEDHRFHLHRGVDCIAIARAFYQTLVHRCRQGGSTIEQQLVRTLTKDYRRNYSRKFRELLLASTLARFFSKQDVLRAYLSVAYFGTNMVGLPQAIKKSVVPDVLNDNAPAYLIAHLRYPKPRKAKDHFHHQRLRRAKVVICYCHAPRLDACHLTRKKIIKLAFSSHAVCVNSDISKCSTIAPTHPSVD